MTAKTLAVIVVLAALVATGLVAMHGKGHAALARWMPSMHGGSSR